MGIIDAGAVAPPPKEAVKELERTDFRKGEFSFSTLDSSQCPRKFYLRKILGLESVWTSLPLAYGSAFHEGVEFFYKNRGKEGLSIEDLKLGSIQAFAECWDSFGVAGDLKRSLDIGVILTDRYVDTYAKEDRSMWVDESDVENSQWVMMPNGTSLLCKLDRCIVNDGVVAVVDTKSTGSYLSDFYFRQFEQHMQTSLYYYAMEQILGRCDYVMIDAVHTPILSARSQSTQFARRTFLRNDLQLKEVLNTYDYMSMFIMDGMDLSGPKRASYYRQNQARCADYGGCEFLGICKHGIDHPCVGCDFKFKTPEQGELAKVELSV